MEIKPTLSAQRVLSTTDMYSFMPTSATWAGGVATITFKNHGLVSTDSVVLSCPVTTSGWNAGTKTATVIDKDTFTVPIAVDPGEFPNNTLIGLNKGAVTVACSKYSKTFYNANIAQVDTLGAGTTVALQVKLHEDAPWVADATALGSATIVNLTSRNFMRVVKSGTNEAVVYVQKT